MRIITDDNCLGYHRYGHPERPERISRTREKLRSQTTLKLTWAEPVAAEEAPLLRAHTARHLTRLEQPVDFDMDTAYFPEIGACARRSVGAALAALRAARAGENAFSLMRPPGHHAMAERCMGFCYLNSVAIAALEARALGHKRVAIYDFDVHHGNGTEAILLNRPGLAFFSVHQSPCYPGTGLANAGDNCFNYPVPPGTPRAEYARTLAEALKALQKFKPEIIGVSAGFDAYVRDPLAQGTLEAEDFHQLGTSLRQLGVPVFNVLEGGYSRDLPDLIFAYLAGLEGK
jgi:acetoin utilization deacetylase AcuC-like enzyme